MKDLIAKRYIKALNKNLNAKKFAEITEVFSVLADSFKDKKFISIINNPDVSSISKQEILLDCVKSIKSKTVDNLIKLLIENKRINIIPDIALEMKKDIAHKTKTYKGTINSNSKINSDLILKISNGLGKKFNSSIELEFIKNDFNGLMVSVEDLGIEINFSKTRVNEQIIEYILKAI